jgi:hypothetical protein
MSNGYRLRARGRSLAAAGALATLAAIAFQAAPARAAVPGPGFAIVTMGDSFISGEGVRWNGNEVDGSVQWMADRSSYPTWFGHASDPARIYGASWIDLATGADTGCHRGDPSEADNSGVPATVTFNIACSGAGSAAINTGSPGFKGEMSQVDHLHSIASVNPVRLIVLSLSGNAIMERWIGGCRRELLNRTLIWDQRHLLRVLREYETHHNEHRPHRSLVQAAPLKPLPDAVAELDAFRARRRDLIGGVIHEYAQVA